MEIDKIVSDLVEKRLNDELIKAVSDEFDQYGQTRLRVFVQKIIEECLEKNKHNIREAVEVAIGKAFIEGEPLPKIDFSVSFNMPTYEIERELDRRKPKAGAV